MAVIHQAERRHFPRFQYKTPLRYHIRGESRFKDVETINFGLDGVSFLDTKFLPANTPLKVEINLPYKTVISEGRVIWTSPLPHSDNYHCGIEFLHMDPKDQQILNKFLNQEALY